MEVKRHEGLPGPTSRCHRHQFQGTMGTGRHVPQDNDGQAGPPESRWGKLNKSGWRRMLGEMDERLPRGFRWPLGDTTRASPAFTPPPAGSRTAICSARPDVRRDPRCLPRPCPGRRLRPRPLLAARVPSAPTLPGRRRRACGAGAVLAGCGLGPSSPRSAGWAEAMGRGGRAIMKGKWWAGGPARGRRTHPGRPVRVALHLGEHQVPGLEGVRHAGGGKPRPREAAEAALAAAALAALAAAAVAAAAAARGEAGGGSGERRGRERPLGQPTGAGLLGCAPPDVPPSDRHGRRMRSLRDTCGDRGARRPMRRGVGEEQVNGIG